MRLRADKLFMLGVVGLGLSAAYLMTRASSRVQVPPGGTKPVPLNVPTGALPDAAGPLQAPPPGIAVDTTPTGQPLQLQGARWYHGRLELPASATHQQIDAMLRQMGFGRAGIAYDVQVFTTPLEASKDIFQAFALANPGKGTRWFRARWPLSLEVSVPNPIRPPSLVYLWAAAAPPPEML